MSGLTKELWKDDDDASLVSETQEGVSETPRDEEELVRKQSERETARVSTWRAIVFLALLVTAVSVTATTYALLVKQEDENFRTVVRTRNVSVEIIVSQRSLNICLPQFAQFARTVTDAAINQQADLRAAMDTISNTVSLSAEFLGHGDPAWPNFWPPMFETYAQDFLKTSRAEYWNQPCGSPRKEGILLELLFHCLSGSHQGLPYHSLWPLGLTGSTTSLYTNTIAIKGPGGWVEDDDRDRVLRRPYISVPRHLPVHTLRPSTGTFALKTTPAALVPLTLLSPYAMRLH